MRLYFEFLPMPWSSVSHLVIIGGYVSLLLLFQHRMLTVIVMKINIINDAEKSSPL